MAIPATARTEEMPSGRTYTYVVPSIAHLLTAGYFPEPIESVARKAVSGVNEDESLLTDAEVQAYEDFRARIVAWMVRAIDGEEIELTWKEAGDPEQFYRDDLAILCARALRGGAPKVEREI